MPSELRRATFTVVTFGTPDFSRAVRLQSRNSRRFGAHRHLAYDVTSPAVVRARAENVALAFHTRGYGLWIWKPYIIIDALAQCDAGDYVIYLDAGIAPVADMTPWFGQLSGYPISCHAPVPPQPLCEWTKRDCFVLMGADTPRYHQAATVSAGIQVYRHATDSLLFLDELKAHMRDPRLMDDGANTQGVPDVAGFRAHRHDQSVLSLLAARHALPILREPTQYGRWTASSRERYRCADSSNPHLLNADCPQVLDVHRGRNRPNALVFELWRLKRRIAGARRGCPTI